MKRASAAILLSITFLLAACGPAPSQAPEVSASVPGPVVPVGQPEVRDLGPTTETVWNCGGGGGTVVKHPSMSVVTGHAVEWEVGGTTGVGIHIGEGVIPGGVELSAALEGHYVTQFDQSIQQGTAWDLPAEPNTVVVYTLMWREVWQPGYVEVRLADQSVVRVNVRYRKGIQSEIVGKRVEACEGEQPLTTPTRVVCFIELRRDILDMIPCEGGGKLIIEASDDEAWTSWNGRLSRVVVPPGWKVVLFYETWIPPEYKERDHTQEGFVPLEQGEAKLQLPGYSVYADRNLTKFVKQSVANELNDRVQYLWVFPFDGQELVLSENSAPPYGMELFASYQP